MKDRKLSTTKKIIRGVYLISVLVILLVGISHFFTFAKASSSDLYIYTEVSKVSDPGWKRTVSIGDLSDEVKFKVEIKNTTSEEVDSVTVRFEPAAGFELTEDEVVVTKRSGETSHDPSLLISDSGLNVGSLASWDATADSIYVVFRVKLSYCPWSDLYRSEIRVDSDQTDEVIDKVDITINAQCENLSTEKLVSNTERSEWKKEVLADHGDFVQYKIKLYNPNPLPMTRAEIKDTLPDGLTLKSDSVFLGYGEDTMSPNPEKGDIFGDGYILSQSLAPYKAPDWPYWQVTYKAQVGECPVEGTKVNKAEAWTKWTDAVSDFATVVVASCPEEEADLSIEKYVRWEGTDDWYESIEKETHLFDPGEKVIYKIVVKNTGDADAESVRVVDELPDYISWISGEGEWDKDERKVRFDLGTVKAGEEKDRVYTAKVADEEDLPFTDREQKNVATLYEGDEKIDDDHAQVWINGPEILAARVEKPEELPEAGADALGLVLISLGMIISGWGMKRLVELPTSEGVLGIGPRKDPRCAQV